MQKIVLLSLFLLSATLLLAQVTPRALKADIKTPNAICAACKTKIESTVPKAIDGLVKINVIISRGITQVSYYPDRTNIEELKTAISNCGFDADNVLANTDVYVKLPECCKKSQDQKVPPKPKQ